LADLVGGNASTPDSKNLLEVLLGKTTLGRNDLILEASQRTALRTDKWALIPPYFGPAVAKNVNIELGNDTVWQLYKLDSDLGQQLNVADQFPEKLEELKGLYLNEVDTGMED